MSNFNLYGDQCLVLSANKGADIATQRADDLDLESVRHAQAHEAMNALDVGCGAGGQAARLAGVGANVIGLDMPYLVDSFDAHVQTSKESYGNAWGGAQFFGCNMLEIPQEWLDTHAKSFLQITCQRAIHYVPRSQAVMILVKLRGVLADNGKMFISCSGLNSELGQGYEVKLVSSHERFGLLSLDMQNKHQIKQSVCLYTQDEFSQMLREAGWRIDTIYASAFGNIKAVASKE
jgi:2-polyprenyl-3-methyl-5-hydroxy-6-metoxy-1,4-benzoquinol methylase